MATKLAQCKGRLAAHVRRDIESAFNRQVGSVTGTLNITQFECAAGFHCHGLPEDNVFAIELCFHIRTGQGNDAIDVKY